MKLMHYPRIILAGTHSGVGKTTLAQGVILALSKRGLIVQPFKAGPDYIDPTYHLQASGRSSYNLDSWLLSQAAILELFKEHAKNADISIIEGVMGLYDGLKYTEVGSTAHLAKILNCPVILILDARSLSRSAAAMVLGYREFDKKVKISGLILNNIKSTNHYNYIKAAIENKTGIPLLGYLPQDADLRLPERHLGLIPVKEKKLSRIFSTKLIKLIKRNIDLEKISHIAKSAPGLPDQKMRIYNTKFPLNPVTIAIAKDRAFNFYYPDNLEILQHLGAKLVEFSPLNNQALPNHIDGLYIGGGFPELFAFRLAKNIRLKQEIYQKACAGLPIYAECGGLMYLAERLVDFKKKSFSMVGIFKCRVNMASKPQGLGYVNVETIKDNILSQKGARTKAHIFHWSYLDNLRNISFAYKIRKNVDNVFYDGLFKQNILASYAHLHFASNINLAKNFIQSCKAYQNGNAKKIK